MEEDSTTFAKRLENMEARRMGNASYGAAAALAYLHLVANGELPAITDAASTGVMLRAFRKAVEDVRGGFRGESDAHISYIAAIAPGHETPFADWLVMTYELALSKAFDAAGIDELPAATPVPSKSTKPTLLCNLWAFSETLLGRKPDPDEYARLHSMENPHGDELAEPAKSMRAGIAALKRRYKNLQESDS